MKESIKKVTLQNALTFALVIAIPLLVIGWDVYRLLEGRPGTVRNPQKSDVTI